jgi:Uma2 family endonuclease
MRRTQSKGGSTMSTPKAKLLITPEEYLAFEREAEERHEWRDGVIYEMAGESPQHSIINANVIASLNLQLRGRPCITFSPNMKIRSRVKPEARLKGLFSYADTMVVCGEPQFHDKYQDVITNPTVVVEVLSDSTKAYDRDEKFDRYAQNPSLKAYILIAQDRPKIELFSRRENGHWDYFYETSLDGRIHIDAIQCDLSLAEVYDRINFEPADDAQESDAE